MVAKRDMPETVAYHPFERLKELMAAKGFVPSGRPVHKKQDIPDEERENLIFQFFSQR
jgi:hypothetical protein